MKCSRQRAVQCNLVVDSMEMCTNGITVPDTDTGCVRMDKDFPDGIVFAKWSSGFREKIFFKPVFAVYCGQINSFIIAVQAAVRFQSSLLR